MRLTPAFLLTLLCAVPVRADDVGAFLKQAKDSSGPAAVAGKAVEGPGSTQACQDLVTPAPKPGKLCTDFENCEKYCGCACTFHKEKWGKEEEDTDCPGADVTGVRMLASNDTKLFDLKKKLEDLKQTFSVLELPGGQTLVTQEVFDGLTKLDAALRDSPKKAEKKYRARIGNCYRTHLKDTQKECGLVLKASYMLTKVKGDAEKEAHWLEEGNPQKKGLAWPGATPHSAGTACDIILMDEHGVDCFDWRAGIVLKPGEKGPPVCTIEAREAVNLLTDIATAEAVGARRLNYEAWHFEWDPSYTDARCAGDDCQRYWPLTGKPN